MEDLFIWNLKFFKLLKNKTFDPHRRSPLELHMNPRTFVITSEHRCKCIVFCVCSILHKTWICQQTWRQILNVIGGGMKTCMVISLIDDQSSLIPVGDEPFFLSFKAADMIFQFHCDVATIFLDGSLQRHFYLALADRKVPLVGHTLEITLRPHNRGQSHHF